jgi:deoxyribose-phosphate aldolase
MNRAQLAARIDHTLLRPDASAGQIRALCDEALEHGCKAVCVHGSRLPLAVERLSGSLVRVATVAGFPLGASSTAIKVAEAAWAREAGAGEIDCVLNIGALKEGDHAFVLDEIAQVVAAAGGALVKIILETCLLAADEQRAAVELAVKGGAAFVKTSTGFSSGGATVGDVRRLKEAAGGRIQVKAAGGIRDARAALALIEAGADRLGTSRTSAILADLPV